MKRLSLLLALIVPMAFADSAAACEGCRWWYGSVTCWSGYTRGAEWCYGGWGTACETGGTCVVPIVEGVSAGVLAPSEHVCTDGPLGCNTLDRERPTAGFALDRPS